MQNRPKVLIVFGILFIIIQIISFIGMSRMHIGLYPDGNDLPYPGYSHGTSGLNLKKVFFAMGAGFDRFQSGLEDLRYSKNEYRVMSATQMASAMVRESLGCSKGGSLGLIIYDIVLALFYSIVGLVGIGLLIIASIVHKLDERKKWQKYLEEKYNITTVQDL